MEKTVTELIAIPSQSGHEAQISEHIRSWMSERNIVTYEQSGNAIGYIPGRDNTKCLILSGHVDTVGVGDLEQWDTDPFKPVVHEGKIYGLGASDMKAGVAVLMELAATYATETPSCDIWFAFVHSEEVDGAGTQAFLNWFQRREQVQTYEHTEAIIAEPTDANFVEVGHRGNQFVKIVMHSESGHASQPAAVKNPAIEVAGKIIGDIRQLETDWSHTMSHPQLGSPTIGVTGIWAGDVQAPNKIAGEATLQLDVRTTPELHDQTKVLLNEFLSKYEGQAHVIECSGSPAGWTDEASRLRSLWKKHFPLIEQQVMIGSSDLCFFTSAGIPTVIFGPGQKKAMHNTNEYAEIMCLHKSFRILKNMVELYGAD